MNVRELIARIFERADYRWDGANWVRVPPAVPPPPCWGRGCDITTSYDVMRLRLTVQHHDNTGCWTRARTFTDAELIAEGSISNPIRRWLAGVHGPQA